ncbi:hypothetical protein [Noviherbaspirillum autotrophicum]|uniref:hypothetical protein n=1 Tax=Noviherbaspirillum autotrophicum TaxID=709839 RepID=UPI0012FDCF4A|nr:hypothetical protein [Noviherbaspirillum autotrophicum]
MEVIVNRKKFLNDMVRRGMATGEMAEFRLVIALLLPAVKTAAAGYTFLHCQKIFSFQALVKASIGSSPGDRHLG